MKTLYQLIHLICLHTQVQNAGNSKFLNFTPGSYAIAYKFMQLREITKLRARFLKPRARSCVNPTLLRIIRTQMHEKATQ